MREIIERVSKCLNRTSVGLKHEYTLALLISMGVGLNRTSVGLKLLEWTRKQGLEDRPQSNQRGIETLLYVRTRLQTARLNRTSVGLKPEDEAAWRFMELEPQSNQRGIETKAPLLPGPGAGGASIEPAWD